MVGGSARLSEGVQEIRLANGFTALLVPRHQAPFFSAVIYVDAGGVDEELGESGIAHLLEHMAFKGTPWIGTRDWASERKLLSEIEQTAEEIIMENAKATPDPATLARLRAHLSELQKETAQFVVPNEYDQIITRAGGQEINATTSKDWTNYFMTLPSNRLELWAMMESERLTYPAWREFYKERDVVAEERRMRTEDSPAGRLYEEFIVGAFKAHPYGTPVIGWMNDLENLTVRRTANFYHRYYRPDNMVAVLVGDLNPTQVKPILEKYFGSLPKGAQATRRLPVEPPQNSFRKVEVPFEAQPQVLVGWHKPTFPHRDAYVFEVLQYLLTANGRSARLFERLVKKDGLCESIECFTAPGDKYPNLFCVWMTPRAPHTAQEVQSVLWEELERLKYDPVTTEELEKTRNQIDASFLRELESNLGFARRLGAYYLLTRDAHALDKFRDAMKSVTAAEIQVVAQRYFTLENTTVAEIVPKSRLSATLKVEETRDRASAPLTTSTERSSSAK